MGPGLISLNFLRSGHHVAQSCVWPPRVGMLLIRLADSGGTLPRPGKENQLLDSPWRAEVL